MYNTEIMANIAKDPAIGLNGAVAAELRAERTAKGITFDTLTERVGLSSPRSSSSSTLDASSASKWTAGCFSDSACFVLQAAFFRSRNSLSTSSGVRYPRAE